MVHQAVVTAWHPRIIRGSFVGYCLPFNPAVSPTFFKVRSPFTNHNAFGSYLSTIRNKENLSEQVVLNILWMSGTRANSIPIEIIFGDSTASPFPAQIDDRAGNTYFKGVFIMFNFAPLCFAWNHGRDNTP